MRGSDPREGTGRILCATPAGADLTFRSNVLVLCGNDVSAPGQVAGSAFPSIGLSDYAFECWWKYLATFDAWGGAFSLLRTKFVGESTSSTRGTGFGLEGTNIHAQFTDNGASIIRVSTAIPYGWTHLAMNCDRDANLEFLINGRSVGTSSIAAHAAIDFSSGMMFGGLLESVAGARGPSGLIAAAAFYNRLLTDAEIRKSVAIKGIAAAAGAKGAYLVGHQRIPTAPEPWVFSVPPGADRESLTHRFPVARYGQGAFSFTNNLWWILDQGPSGRHLLIGPESAALTPWMSVDPEWLNGS